MGKKYKRTSASLRRLTTAALIASLYAVMSYISSVIGLSSGAIQFRLSEMLILLPLILPEAVGGLFVGCIISNVISGCVIWDVIFGSLATLLGALGALCLRRLPRKLKWLASLPNLVINSTVIPFILMYAYGIEQGYFLLMLSVGIGELVCGVILASLLYYSLCKNIRKF